MELGYFLQQDHLIRVFGVMSTTSTHSKGVNRRFDSSKSTGSWSRDGSRPRKCIITHNDAYIYALRVAYLSYLLQPKARRTQYVPAPKALVQRSSSSINDLMKDFSPLKDSKGTRLPHGFVSELEKRLTGVLMGREKSPEYNDASIKRTFAAFFNAFVEKSFKRSMEKDRRVEDLLLIFFSNATRELQKGKPAGDEALKLMVDRHVALFVRLISLVLKDREWARDRPELANRLATLESKLLAHDQDLAASESRNGGAGGSTIEVVVPLTYEVKDMPLVQVVARIFGLTNTQVQSDITKNKFVWTEKAALQDLKTYQSYLNLNSRKTLRSDDFDLEEGYEAWRKAEGPELSQMMLAIIQSSPELAKTTSPVSQPQLQLYGNGINTPDSGYSDSRMQMSENVDNTSYVIEQPVDMSFFRDNSPESYADEDHVFTFVPPDTRAYYRFILAQAFSHDFNDKNLSESPDDMLNNRLLSKQSTDLLQEISLRWRLPRVSTIMLFLDVVREKYLDNEINLDILDGAFNSIKEQQTDGKGQQCNTASLLLDRGKWTLADFTLNQQILGSLHDALLRELYGSMQHCYEQKPPAIGPIIYVLEHRIYDDPSFTKMPEDLDHFTNQLYQGLQQKAHEMYQELVEVHIPVDQHRWECQNVIELGKAVLKLAERVQKRYRKSPEIMGYSVLGHFSYIY